MRGVVALAAANSLPLTLSDGTPFPQRSFIIYLTFFLIMVTLVLQGFSLPWVIRILGLSGRDMGACEEMKPGLFSSRQPPSSSDSGETRQRMKTSATFTMIFYMSTSTE